jgi:hypothetical protein
MVVYAPNARDIDCERRKSMSPVKERHTASLSQSIQYARLRRIVTIGIAVTRTLQLGLALSQRSVPERYVSITRGTDPCQFLDRLAQIRLEILSSQ